MRVYSLVDLDVPSISRLRVCLEHGPLNYSAARTSGKLKNSNKPDKNSPEAMVRMVVGLHIPDTLWAVIEGQRTNLANLSLIFTPSFRPRWVETHTPLPHPTVVGRYK